MNRSKIIIAEPSLIIASGLVRLLEGNPSFDIVAVVDEMDKLQERLTLSKPDILIINPQMVDYLKRIMLRSVFQKFPNIAIIALVSNYIEQSILRQYHGVIEITDSVQRIEFKIKESLTHFKNLQEIPDNHELSEREKDVLVAVAKGMMNKEIAEKLNISIHTVISHRKNITRKTDIKSVAGLTVYALLNNLIEESDVQ